MLRCAPLSLTETASRLRRVEPIFGAAFQVSCLVLALQAADPIAGRLPWRPGMASAANAIALLILLSGVARALLSPRVDMRACAVAISLGGTYLLMHLDAWGRSTAGRASSALAEALSSTRLGVPWIALAMALSVLALGVVQFDASRHLALGGPTVVVRSARAVLVGICTVLWLRALLGYASGSSALLAPLSM